jgi:hypothetical protein
MLSRDEVILKLGELQHELRTWKKVLQVIDRSQIEKRTGTAMRFYGMRPSSAIKMLLRDRGAQTQEWLLQELSDGGINVGKKRGEHNPRIAIEKTLRTGALKKVGNLIGLPEWGDEMFKGASFDEDDEKRA